MRRGKVVYHFDDDMRVVVPSLSIESQAKVLYQVKMSTGNLDFRRCCCLADKQSRGL